MADEQQGGAKPPPPGVPMTPTRRRLGTGRAGGAAGGGAAPPPKPPAGTAPADPQAAQISGALPAEQTPVDPVRPAAAQPRPAEQAASPAAEPTPTTPAAPRAGAPDVPQPARPAPTPDGDDARQQAQAARAVPAQGGPAGPAPTARPAPARPAAAPAAARPAAMAPAAARPAAARPAAANGPAGRPAAAGATAQRLAEAASREPAAGGGAQAQSLVYVWPHLVTIEFVSALLLLLSMVVLAWVVNAPLEAHANPDHTPNPSKAPWYFLNLQELLLHMHPALAGVIVPSAALGAIAAIPYFDRDQVDVGKWFGTAKAVPIALWVTVYTVIVEVAEIFFDELVGVKPLMATVANATGIAYFSDPNPLGIALLSMPNVIVPTALMLGPIIPLMLIIHRVFKPNTREVMVALFTGFVVSYVILTIFGTFFRGQGMHLCWLTDPCQIRID